MSEKTLLLPPTGKEDLESGGYQTVSHKQFSGDYADLQFCKLSDDGRFSDLSKATLSWRNLNVKADKWVRGSMCSDKKGHFISSDILKNVSGYVEPGQFVAILGSSGSGKTTLLNTLAQRKMCNFKTSGTIHLNGWPIERSQMSLVSAYVEQEDNFIGVLTVRETLIFHATLRMDKDIPMETRMKKVEAIMDKLCLKSCENTIIGNPRTGMKGISGGQKKRLSVAVELLMDPPLLFLDEPTSGLDSFMAQNMVKLISKLAAANRTILMTIHQPSSEVFALFDRICLLADGHIAYFGDRSDALAHFEAMKRPCPSHYNPADHFVFQLAIQPCIRDKCLASIRDIVSFYKKSGQYREIKDKVHMEEKINQCAPFISRETMQSSSYTQLVENVKRAYLIAKRSPSLAKSRWIETLVWGILIGISFFMVNNDQEVAQNKGGLLFFFTTNFTFAFSFGNTSVLPNDFPILLKEYRVGMYGIASYLWSIILMNIPKIVVLVFVQLLLSYFLTGLETSAGSFFTAYVICMSTAWVASNLGLFAGSMTGSVPTANALNAPLIMPFFLFGGLYQNDNSTPYWFYPVKYLSWIRYSWNALMVNEFADMRVIECNDDTAGFDCIYTDGKQILSIYGIQETIWFPNVVCNLFLGLLLSLLSLMCLWRRTRKL